MSFLYETHLHTCQASACGKVNGEDYIPYMMEKGYAGKEVCFGFRPEDLSEVPLDSDNAIKSTVRVYELLGAEVFLYFDLGDVNMTARVDPATTARPGSEVALAINMDHIHAFDKDTEIALF